jgi:hypothetical protein
MSEAKDERRTAPVTGTPTEADVRAALENTAPPEGWTTDAFVQYMLYISTVRRWMREKWGAEFKCPMCRATDWTVLAPVEAPLRPGKSDTMRGMALVFSPVQCNNCANTLFLFLKDITRAFADEVKS